MKKITKITDWIWQETENHKHTLFFAFFLVFTLFIAFILSQKLLITIPQKGGEINEIIIGEKARFINPVLALSPIDKDLISLIYTPLLKIDNDGKVISNIADYELLENKKTYIITLKENIYFHDNVQLTADDIIFTIEKIQDPLIKSPYYGSWLGVQATKINDLTVEIKLKNEYYQFINNLVNLSPLPKHLWKNVAPEEFPFSKLNVVPIGSGPFQVERLVKNNSDEVQQYILKSFSKYHIDEPYLNKIIFNFFTDLKSYQDSLLVQNSSIQKTFFSTSEVLLHKIVPENKIIILRTTKEFGVFINPTDRTEAILNKKFRTLFSQVLTGEKITKDDFEKLYGFTYSNKKELLFNKTPININITYIPEKKFEEIITQIKNNLNKVGININLKKINNQSVIKDIIRDRNFDMILFGYNPGIIADLFYFFHSAQRNDPGANIAGINDSNIDKLLLELRKNISASERKKKEKELKNLINKTALFISLYSPQEFYGIPVTLKEFNKKLINSRENRFDNVENWYLLEEQILPFLKKNINNK